MGSLYGKADNALGGYLPGGNPPGFNKDPFAWGTQPGEALDEFGNQVMSIMPGNDGGLFGLGKGGGGLEGILGTASKVGNLLGGLKGVAGGGQMATTPAAAQHAANAGQQPSPILLGGGPAGSIQHNILNATTPGGIPNASASFNGANIPPAAQQEVAAQVLKQLIQGGGGLGGIGLGGAEASLGRSGLGAPGRVGFEGISHHS
jgi:hypothetical protein